MSLNLCFFTKSKPHAMIDFPFQTPTNLTRAVMAEKDNAKRLTMLRNEMVAYKWEQDIIDRKMETIESHMNNPTLELSYL